MFLSSSRTSKLCKFLFVKALEGALSSQNICKRHGFPPVRFLCEKGYQGQCKKVMKFDQMCSLTDRVKFDLFKSCDILTINNLLSPF